MAQSKVSVGTMIQNVSMNDSFQTFIDLEKQLQDNPNISVEFPGL